MFAAITEHGITGRAYRNQLYNLQFFNPRAYTSDVHKTVDDRPYGGGPGMLMLYQPLKDAIEDARATSNLPASVVYLSPQGKLLNQSKVDELVKKDRLILLCGRYEGIDERLIEAEVDEEISIGDYVLSGGELAAMVLIDSLVRQLPGVLGHKYSAEEDSFKHGLLDTPHYTRPEVIDGRKVPEVLLSGNHQRIAQWRQQRALERTRCRRPDLMDGK